MLRLLAPKDHGLKPAHTSKKQIHTAEKGFTLVEGMVGGTISVVLVGVLLTIMNMNNDGVKNGAINTQAQSQYEIALQEIADAAREASGIVDGSEAWPLTTSVTAATTSKIEMYYQDAAGTITKFRGFWIDNGILKEWKPGWSAYQAFIVGSWPAIKVVDATPFSLSADRRIVTVSMQLKTEFSGDTAIAPARGEIFACRN
jgi:type II secretory pathway pseudopilin PulG